MKAISVAINDKIKDTTSKEIISLLQYLKYREPSNAGKSSITLDNVPINFYYYFGINSIPYTYPTLFLTEDVRPKRNIHTQSAGKEFLKKIISPRTIVLIGLE